MALAAGTYDAGHEVRVGSHLIPPHPVDVQPHRPLLTSAAHAALLCACSLDASTIPPALYRARRWVRWAPSWGTMTGVGAGRTITGTASSRDDAATA